VRNAPPSAGAGRTPFARGSDGRATLRGTIREFLCSEALHALEVATTRVVAVVGTHRPPSAQRPAGPPLLARR